MPAIDLEGGRRGEALLFTIPTVFVAMVAVILRFVARAKTVAKYGADDIFILLSLMAFIVTAWANSWPSLSGVYDKNHLALPNLKVSLKAVLFGTLFTALTITFAKLSLLALYHRIFAIKTFRRWIYAIGATCIGWGVACVFVAIFRCFPIKIALDPLLYFAHQDRCINLVLFFMIVEPINCLQDLIIVIMPLNVISRLRLPLAKRLSLGVIFALGGFVCVTSIVRIVYSWAQDGQSLHGLLRSGKWLHIQLSCAIVGACLPVYGPLLPENGIFPTAVTGWYARNISKTSKSRSRQSETGRLNKTTSKSPQVTDAEDVEIFTATTFAKSAPFQESKGLPLESIHVSKAFRIDHV